MIRRSRIIAGTLAAVAGLVAVAIPALAGEIGWFKLSVTAGTNSVGLVTDTNTAVRGWVEEIQIDTAAAGTTGDVFVVLLPNLATQSSREIARKNSCAADVVVVPFEWPTTAAGVAYTNWPPVRYPVAGGVMLSVTNASASNAVFNVVVVYEKPDK